MKKPTSAIWEITRSCISGEGAEHSDELSTAEALQLCDDLADLGIQQLTLSGTDPFLRSDWFDIARRLTQNGVAVHAVSSGWLLDDTLLESAVNAGIVHIAISLDGVGKSHDFIHQKGSWERSIAALEHMHDRGLPLIVRTHINRRNLNDLPKLKKQLIRRNIQRWQLELARPSGNPRRHSELLILPNHLQGLIQFCHQVMTEKKLTLELGCNIGFFSAKDTAIRSCASHRLNGRSGGSAWNGCQAGKTTIGIHANGAISPCLSIQYKMDPADSIRIRPLTDIWFNSPRFNMLRSFSAETFTGFCRNCPYAADCMGGCAGWKLALHQTPTQNDYCLFKIEIEQAKRIADLIHMPSALAEKARACIAQNLPYHAEIYLKRAFALESANVECLKLAGYLYFSLKQFERSLEYNEAALSITPDDLNALKGKGLCLVRLHHIEKGLALLRECTEKAQPDFMDPYHDLARILIEQNRLPEARSVLDDGCIKNATFLRDAKSMYAEIRRRAMEGDFK